MAAHDELVMVVRTEELFRPGYFHGLQLGDTAPLGDWMRTVFEPRHSRFLPRAQAETDPSWKQVIPYVVLACGDEVFCYRRGLRSSEARLHKLHSIGLGGHIRASDERLFTPPGWPAYDAALRRELAEEVELGAAVREERLVGLLNDDSTDVGQVHVGLVHLWRLAAPAVAPRESKIADGRFLPIAALAARGADQFETWSQLVLGEWNRLNDQTGWAPD
ncbi:MAG: hypothetical protein ACRD1L_00055 [Terriglobales bacterium]